MANWWEYLEETEYRKRKADKFGQEAKAAIIERQQPEGGIAGVLTPQTTRPGGALGGALKAGEIALKPFEWEHKYISGPAVRGLDITARAISTPIRMATRGESPEEAWAMAGRPEVQPPGWHRATTELMASPSSYVGLGVTGSAARTVGLGKYAPGLARLEDIAIGGPIFRAAGRVAMAPFKAATRRFAPDVPKAAGVVAKATDEKILAQQDESVRKLTTAIKDAVRPARETTEELYTVERARRAARLEKIPADIGEEALARQRQVLKGPLPKAELEPLKLTGEDINHLFNRINQADIPVYDKVAAREALAKLLNPQGPEIPGLKEIARLEKIFGSELPVALRGLRTLPQKLRDAAVDAINLPRAVLAAYDYSAPLRQGLLLMPAKPRSWLLGVKRGMRWMFDPDYTRDRWHWMMTSRETHPLQPEIVASARGRLLTEPGGAIGVTEERFGSEFARNIPGIQMSERGYIGPLNEMRFDALFDEIRQYEQTMGRTLNLGVKGKGAAKDIAWLDQEIEALATLTGRGNLPGFLKQHEGLLGALLFAPRLLWARLSAPALLFSKNPQVRKMAAKGLAGAVGANVALLSMMKATGQVDVETDPRSTDFGKLRIGDTRMDFLGGYQPIVRYGAQLITGQRKTTVAGEIYGIDRKQVVLQFLRTKLSPVAGIITDVASGETMLGDPVTGDVVMKESEFWEYVEQRLTPMFIQDFEEAIRESGLIPGAFLATPGAFGASVMSYAWPAQRMDELSQKVMGQPWKDLNYLERKELLEKSPEAQEVWLEYIEMGVKRGQDWAEGIYEGMESNSELEARLSEALQTGASKADVAADYQYYRYSSSFDGDEEREPRDEQEKRMMDYWAIKPEDFPRPDGTTDFDAFYEAQREYIEGVPETKEDFNRNELLKWKNPIMRGFIEEWQRANDLWSEYYEIPSKLGMEEEEMELARDALAQVTTLQFANPGLSTRRALRQLNVPDAVKWLALRYNRLRSNPEREAFRREHGAEMALIKPPEFGAAVTEEEIY